MTINIKTSLKDFDFWWGLKGDWIEEPNYRRGGESGVLKVTTEEGQHLYIKRQNHHIYRSLLHPLGRPTILREYKAYCAFQQAKVPTPELIYFGCQAQKAILVTKALNNFVDFDQWLTRCRQQNTPSSIITLVLDEIAHTLANLHKNRLQHNCLYGKHIFVNVTNNHENPIAKIALIDLEKARKRLSSKMAALHDIPQIKRHSLITEKEWLYFITQYEKAFGQKVPSLYKL